jgi:hypothetical protein
MVFAEDLVLDFDRDLAAVPNCLSSDPDFLVVDLERVEWEDMPS